MIILSKFEFFVNYKFELLVEISELLLNIRFNEISKLITNLIINKLIKFVHSKMQIKNKKKENIIYFYYGFLEVIFPHNKLISI